LRRMNANTEGLNGIYGPEIRAGIENPVPRFSLMHDCSSASYWVAYLRYILIGIAHLSEV
jgi:hypothetical protein